MSSLFDNVNLNIFSKATRYISETKEGIMDRFDDFWCKHKNYYWNSIM